MYLQAWRAEAARHLLDIRRLLTQAAHSQRTTHDEVERVNALVRRRAELLRSIAKATGEESLVRLNGWEKLDEYDVDLVALETSQRRAAFVLETHRRSIVGGCEWCLELRKEELSEARRSEEGLYEHAEGRPGAYEVERSVWRTEFLRLAGVREDDRIGPLTYREVVHSIILGRETILHLLGTRPVLLGDAVSGERAFATASAFVHERRD